MLLINCEASLTFNWSKYCVITDETTQNADSNANPSVPKNRAPIGSTFKLTDAKLYVPVVTLSIEENNKRLEQLKTGFKRTVKWNNADQK